MCAELEPIPAEVEWVIIECKVADAIIAIHTRQVTSYLRTTGLRLGFIFNFNVDVLIPSGFRRVAL